MRNRNMAQASILGKHVVQDDQKSLEDDDGGETREGGASTSKMTSHPRNAAASLMRRLRRI